MYGGSNRNKNFHVKQITQTTCLIKHVPNTYGYVTQIEKKSKKIYECGRKGVNNNCQVIKVYHNRLNISTYEYLC